MLLQPDEGQDETPTIENLPPVNDEVDVSTDDVSKLKISSETVEESTLEQVDAFDTAVKNHTSPRIADHTSPASPCSTRSADDNGEQKLSTPGAASSGYGSAVLTQTTSSDDLLGDHTGNDEISGERSSAGHSNSMVVTAEVNIIDAAVPADLDSPLKPTTPYADEPASVPAASSDVSIIDSSLSVEPEVDEPSLERSAVSFGAILNHRSGAKTDSENAGKAVPLLDTVKQTGGVVDDEDNKNKSNNSTTESLNDGTHMEESVTDLPSGVSHHTSSVLHVDDDFGTVDDAGLTDSLPKSLSVDRSGVTVRSTSGSATTSYRPVSMPPEMTIIEDEKVDITTLGTSDQSLLCLINSVFFLFNIIIVH